MVIDQAKKIEVINKFKAIYAIEDEKSKLSSSISDIKKSLAEHLEEDKTAISEAYREWKIRLEKKETKEKADEIIESIL